MEGCPHKYIYVWDHGDIPSCSRCGRSVESSGRFRRIAPSDSVRAGRYLADIYYFSKHFNEPSAFENVLRAFNLIRLHLGEAPVDSKDVHQIKLSSTKLEAYRQQMKAIRVERKEDRYVWNY